MQNLMDIVAGSAAQPSAIAFLAIFLAGVATSLSPCVLPVLPLIVGYMGGYAPGDRRRAFLMSLALVGGLTVTLVGFGLATVSLGLIFGHIGKLWHWLVSGVLIVMGLQLLGLVQLRLPGIEMRLSEKSRAGYLGAFLAGMAFGLVTSSCGMPILVAVLSYVSLSGSFIVGGTALLLYSAGRSIVLLAIAAAAGLAKGISRFQPYAELLNRASGALLVAAGIYLLLTNG